VYGGDVINMDTTIKKKPEEWLKEVPLLEILDPDGWDRSPEKWEASWNEPITAEEFGNRVAMSTCAFYGPPLEVFAQIEKLGL
jgi:hypothetical protein